MVKLKKELEEENARREENRNKFEASLKELEATISNKRAELGQSSNQSISE